MNPAPTETRLTYRLIRDIPVEEGFDLVVAGGGPAGTAAAIAAGRLGARVLLSEAVGCLGGMGTSGGVNAFDPMANGERMLVGGVQREIVERMHARGFLGPGMTPEKWSKQYHVWTLFHGEGLKLVLDEMVTEAGVEMRFFTRVIDADVTGDRRVNGVVLQNIEGYRYIKAKTFIDATGDGVLADLCGVPCRTAGRDTPKIMPPTLTWHVTGIDWSRFNSVETYFKKLLPLFETKDEKSVSEAARKFPLVSRHAAIGRTGQRLGCANAGQVFNTDALNFRSLSDAMMRGRKIVQQYLDFYREYGDGCEEIELVSTSPLLGVRESRRIVGEYELGVADYLARRQFPDQIGVFNKFIDIHPYDNSEEEFQRFRKEMNETGRLGPGECFGIPYGIIVPQGWQNLWVAGRCSCSDVLVHGSIRVMPAAAMMGQAAGAAAVQSIRTGQTACNLDTAALVTTLREQGAYLPQTTLSLDMTRAG